MEVFPIVDEDLAQIPFPPFPAEFKGCRLLPGVSLGIRSHIESEQPKQIELQPAFAKENMDVDFVGERKELLAADIPDGAVAVRHLFDHKLNDEVQTWVEWAVEICLARSSRLEITAGETSVSVMLVSTKFEMLWVLAWDDVDEYLERA
jgi:hypothetical protein